MSTVNISLDPAEVNALAQRLGRAVEDVQAAAQLSAHATAEWLRTRIVDDLVRETGLAQTVFARRVKNYVHTGVVGGGRVFVGLFRPEASRSNLGRLRQGKTGATGSKKFFKGAFVATMPSGFVGIFRRTGRFGRRGNQDLERIDVEHVDLPSAQAIIARHESPAIRYFRQDIERRLKGALG